MPYAISSIVVLILLIYMVYKAHYDIINYQTIYDEKLPIHFSEYRIFFIADIHRRRIKESTLALINSPIDIVLIGGDLTEKGVAYERTRNNINRLKRWDVPIYFVMGNNDYEVLPDQLESLLQKDGVIVLKDQLEKLQREGRYIYLYGFDYYESNDYRPPVKWEHSHDNYSILLTHTPASFYELNSDLQKKINLVLAGHTHGGQIRLGPLGLYRKGGLTTFRNTNVLVSEGYGYSLLPFRFQTKAECHVITIKKEGN